MSLVIGGTEYPTGWGEYEIQRRQLERKYAPIRGGCDYQEDILSIIDSAIGPMIERVNQRLAKHRLNADDVPDSIRYAIQFHHKQPEFGMLSIANQLLEQYHALDYNTTEFARVDVLENSTLSFIKNFEQFSLLFCQLIHNVETK